MPRRVLVALIAGALILFLTLGVRQGFGLFLAPMSADLGWGREVFSLAIAIQNIVWGLCQPFVGMVADQYGARRVVMVGAVAYTIGLVMMALSEAPWMLHLGGGVFVGFALSAVSFVVVLGSVGRMVPKKNLSLALGIVSAGGSLGQFVMVPGTGSLLAAMGWSPTLLVLAVGPVLIIPLALLFRGGGGADAVEPESDQTLREALGEAGRHRGFWYLAAGFFVCGFHITFIMVHLPAFITDAGLESWLGAAALSSIGFFNIVGTYLCGYLGGRFRKKYILSILYLLRALFITIFILVPVTPYSVLIFTSAMGVLWLGTVPLTSALVAEVFGVRYLSTLFGIVFFSHQVGSFLGVWLGGLVYDFSGSYDIVWLIAIVLGLAAALLHWPIADAPVPRLSRATAPAGT
jgi:MFS family permease